MDKLKEYVVAVDADYDTRIWHNKCNDNIEYTDQIGIRSSTFNNESIDIVLLAIEAHDKECNA